MAIITNRFLRANPTIQSIIEKHPAPGDDALAGFEAFLDDDQIALLEARLDQPRLERPRSGLDKSLIAVLLQYKRSGRYDRHILCRREESDVGEHGRLQPVLRISKGDPDFRPTRIRIKDLADEEHPALEDF